MNQEYKELWIEIEVLLKEARALLSDIETGEDGFSERRFQEYLSHNELGLALDELEGIPLYNEVPREFWQLLLRAANRMRLKDKIAEYTRTLNYYK